MMEWIRSALQRVKNLLNMRRKITLYLADQPVDLDNQSFILFNYTMEDLSNPTIVKNAFSQQITLKGTPRNNAVFGYIFRNDRETQYSQGEESGIYYDPTRKTPFTIYNEMGEILESGYFKLDRVTTRRKMHEYTITLYGGLGSFLYGLTYHPNGDKMEVADLDFGLVLDFDIDRNTILTAWDRLNGGASNFPEWDILNFAPCLNGKPSKPFDANRAIVNAATAGLVTKDGDYNTREGFTLVQLNEEVTEQEAKDYRSYLQRPVLRLRKLIEAICSPANNGGWMVNLDSEFFNNNNPYWNKTWITLPMLNELNMDVVADGGTLPTSIGTLTIPGGGNLSLLYNVNLHWAISPIFDTSPQAPSYWMHCEDDWAAGDPVNDNPGFYLNYIEINVKCYDSQDNMIREIVYRVSTRQAPEGYTQMDDTFDYITDANECIKDGSGYHMDIDIQEYGLAKVVITQDIKSMSWGNLRAAGDPMLVFPENTYDFTLGESIYSYNFDHDNSAFRWGSFSSSSVRTGATISQRSLLSGGHSPAEYLLSFCKTFGLQMVCHRDEKKIDILMRKNLYNGNIVDLTKRIDRGRDIVKLPYAFDARWYGFENGYQGDFAEYYAEKYGRTYGKQRVNTGYDFDASERNLTESIVFNGVCDVTEVSKYFCELLVKGMNIPAVFLSGGKYKLYKLGGESKDYDIQFIAPFSISWINPTHPMHDHSVKPQFHKADNGHMDIRDVLLFFDGMGTPGSTHVTLSDDIRVMLDLNGNNPCWMPGYCDYRPAWRLTSLPKFVRCLYNNGHVTKSLDFGTPFEAMIPDLTFNAGSDIYSQYWARYIADRYDDDSSVVTAHVDFRGMKVDENLLRQFYFFDGAVWALNKIVNYSLTTYDPVVCEFVRVQDTQNYLDD